MKWRLLRSVGERVPEKQPIVPCPFCGDTDAWTEAAPGYIAFVQCACGARGPRVVVRARWDVAEREAVERWARATKTKNA